MLFRSLDEEGHPIEDNPEADTPRARRDGGAGERESSGERSGDEAREQEEAAAPA